MQHWAYSSIWNGELIGEIGIGSVYSTTIITIFIWETDQVHSEHLWRLAYCRCFSCVSNEELIVETGTFKLLQYSNHCYTRSIYVYTVGETDTGWRLVYCRCYSSIWDRDLILETGTFRWQYNSHCYIYVWETDTVHHTKTGLLFMLFIYLKWGAISWNWNILTFVIQQPLLYTLYRYSAYEDWPRK